jgi:hypothetical protein
VCIIAQSVGGDLYRNQSKVKRSECASTQKVILTAPTAILLRFEATGGLVQFMECVSLEEVYRYTNEEGITTQPAKMKEINF